VSGTGQLAIRLTGSGDKPKLTFTETGLTTAEDALGVLSPFNINGRPLTLPVTIAHDRSGC